MYDGICLFFGARSTRERSARERKNVENHNTQTFVAHSTVVSNLCLDKNTEVYATLLWLRFSALLRLMSLNRLLESLHSCLLLICAALMVIGGFAPCDICLPMGAAILFPGACTCRALLKWLFEAKIVPRQKLCRNNVPLFFSNMRTVFFSLLYYIRLQGDDKSCENTIDQGRFCMVNKYTIVWYPYF